jgi:ABC-type transport system involved in multi-copper enzyme maturation permease subunit
LLTASRAGIDRAHYHGWHGRLRSPWLGALAVARVALWQIFRRKLYWIVIALGMFHFLLIFALVFFVAQIEANATAAGIGEKSQASAPGQPASERQRPRGRAAAWVLNMADFTPQPGHGRDNGYVGFIFRQSYIVLILLAFSGSLVIGADFHQRGLTFYLSRGIDRRHYLLGKWLGLAGVISILTVLPALVLYVQYGLYSSNLDYWIEYWWIPLTIIGYGLFVCLVLGLSVMALSVYLRRTVPIAITCFSSFVLLDEIGAQLFRATRVEHWRLLSLWRDVRYAARYCFDPYFMPDDRALGGWALGILAGVCLLCLVVLYRRVQAVEVVE